MRLNVSRDDFTDDELSRACAALLAQTSILGAMQHRFGKVGAVEAIEELKKDEDAIGFVLGMLLQEQVERRKDDAEMAKP
jgi:hypothetical protein